MAVKIRLSRAGKKHVPFHRIVAIDGRKKRDGEVLATIGTYDAIKGTIVQFNEELYVDWVSKGAQPSESALKIFKQFKRAAATPIPAKPAKKTKTKAAKPKKEEAVESAAEEASK